jgi:hypothetical protein
MGMRKEFELWVINYAKENKYNWPDMVLKRDGDVYATTWVDSAWLGWQASREALVIDLPRYVTNVTNKDFEEGRDSVIEAIEAAGLKVKP